MSAPVAAYGDSLSLRYAIRLEQGAEILSNFGDATPDTLTLGDGTLAPKLEQWLIGLAVGDRHVFLLDAEQAFGARSAEMIHTLPISQVATDQALQVDNLVEFKMADGQNLAGRILEIGDKSLKLDFNHPLADLAIEFEVEIIQIRKHLTRVQA